jgi:hypothetical protein
MTMFDFNELTEWDEGLEALEEAPKSDDEDDA